jgi:hypothetical protein
MGAAEYKNGVLGPGAQLPLLRRINPDGCATLFQEFEHGKHRLVV